MSHKSLAAVASTLVMIVASSSGVRAATKVARFAYEANNGQLVAYSVNPTTGGLREIQAIVSPSLTGNAITINPSGKFVYLSTGYAGGGSLYGYAIGKTGLLTPSSGSPFSSAGGTLKFLPTGKFAYANDLRSTVVDIFSVDIKTGALTQIGAASTASVAGDLGITPKGTFVYTPNYGSSNVSAFSVNAGTGALTPVPGSPFSANANPAEIAIHPSGKFVYIGGVNSMEAFSINQTNGALTSIGTVPFATGGGYATVSPNGKYLIAATYGSGIFAFSINQTSGTLTPVPGSPFPTPAAAYGVAVDPSSSYLYVSNLSGSGAPLYTFSIDFATGALTEIGTQGLDGIAGGISAYTTGSAVKYTPTFGYVTNSGGNSITELSIANGGLSFIAGSPVADTNGPQASTATASGKFFYTGNSNGSISEYSVGKTGALKKIAGSPITGLTNPVGMAISPFYNILYAEDPAAEETFDYTINTKTGVLTLTFSGVTDGNGPDAIAVDPFGAFTLVVNNASDQVAVGIPGSGFVNTVPTGSSPVAITIDPSSQFVYVANSGDGTVSAYNLTVASPYLTPIAGSPYTAGTSPSAVVAEPYGRYLYVANSGSHSISAYALDPLAGALTPISGTFSTSGTPSALSVSNDGKYLYATSKDVGELDQFTINSDGTLTGAGGAGVGTAPTSVTTIGTYK